MALIATNEEPGGNRPRSSRMLTESNGILPLDDLIALISTDPRWKTLCGNTAAADALAVQVYDGTSGPVGIDDTTYAINVIDYDHHEIHGGSAYCIHKFIDVPADDVLDVRWVTPNTTTWGHMTFTFGAEAEFHVSMLRGISITNAGTDLTIINQNNNSDNTSSMVAFDYIINTNLTNANADTNVAAVIDADPHSWVLGSGRNIGGESPSRDEVVLKQNTGYCMRFENQSNAAKWIQLNFCWYEHTNKELLVHTQSSSSSSSSSPSSPSSSSQSSASSASSSSPSSSSSSSPSSASSSSSSTGSSSSTSSFSSESSSSSSDI